MSVKIVCVSTLMWNLIYLSEYVLPSGLEERLSETQRKNKIILN